VPEDLLDDEHIREEYGINDFTTPSIEKIFADLASLGDLPYADLRREVPAATPRDRVVLALQMGGLIADGFLVVQSEKLEDIEPVGRALLKHAKVLGAGMRVTRHTKSLLENSVLGEWELLRTELVRTQKDVEAEMVLLRDIDAAHLIALGGWLRALEIGAAAASAPYDEQKTRTLGRVDLIEYFLFSIEGFEPSLQEHAVVAGVRQGLEDLHTTMDVPEGKAFTEQELAALRSKARALVKLVEDAAAKS
jgi:hypothetical protein